MKFTALCILLAFAAIAQAADSAEFVYIGTYTNFELLSPPHRVPPGEQSKGIYVFRFDSSTGALTPLGLAAEAINPTFMALHPTRPLLYAVNEIYQFNGEPTGAVSAYSIDPANGKLKLLNQVASKGTGACHVCVDKAGKNVLVANFGSGSVAVLPIAPDGSLKAASSFIQHSGTGPSPRQAGPHTHSINLSSDNRFAFAAEFGADKLFVYRFDAEAGTLTPHDPAFVPIKPGSAPRHFAFHPNGDIAYVLNEISSTITVLRYDAAKGTFKEIDTLTTLPEDFKGANTAAEIQVHPSGRFLFVSNRGHNSIAVLPIDSEGRPGGASFYSTRGRTPRNFSLDPEGQWLIVANQDTNNIVVFRVSQRSGALDPVGEPLTVPAPLCVRFWKQSDH